MTDDRWAPQQAFLVDAPRFDPPDYNRMAWCAVIPDPDGLPVVLIAWDALTGGLGWLQCSTYVPQNLTHQQAQTAVVLGLARGAAAGLDPRTVFYALAQSFGVTPVTGVPYEVAAG